MRKRKATEKSNDRDLQEIVDIVEVLLEKEDIDEISPTQPQLLTQNAHLLNQPDSKETRAVDE